MNPTSAIDGEPLNRLEHDVLREWGLNASSDISALKSYTGRAKLVTTATGERFVLKRKENQARALAEAALVQELASFGAPVATALETSRGESVVDVNGVAYCLYPHLDGEVLKHYRKYHGSDYGDTAAAIGKAVAQIHLYLRRCRTKLPTRDLNLLHIHVYWIEPELKQYGPLIDLDAVGEIQREVQRELEDLHDELPRQTIHRDLELDNFLFDSRLRLCGLIDLDMATFGPRIFDVCTCVASMLKHGNDQLETRARWAEILQEVLAAYAPRARLLNAERRAIFAVLSTIHLMRILSGLSDDSWAAANRSEQELLWLSEQRRSLGL